ncbi:MAG: FAD:protein FMN transferase [Gammaproteobacteria bacterium]|jgi:thiamine biosynthesis lipoprotein
MIEQLTRLGCLLLILGASGCGQQKDAVFHDQFFAFGTLIDITLYGVELPLAESVSGQIEQDFMNMHASWHAWQPGPLSSLNGQLSGPGAGTIAPSILPLLKEANRLSRLSEGLFNPVLGNLIALWGFHDNALPVGTLPDSTAIRELLDQAPSSNDIHIDGTLVTSRNPSVAYDLGGFAKGYAIDRAIDRLRESGIHNAIVNAGGDLRAIGQHGERPWRIGIRHPRENGILASIEISGDDSVFTSGDYERYFEVDGKRYHHILDPRTGYPAINTTSVTVIHSNAATADAATTALFVAGPDEWPSVALSMGIRHVMLIDNQGIIHMNPAMQSRIQLEPGINAEISLDAPLQ